MDNMNMPRMRFHKLAALVVLVAFAAWMGTGKFSSVGSAAAEAEQKPVKRRNSQRPPLRTVAVVAPPRLQHARAIRISGHTEAEKRALLAIRVMGIIKELPVKQGQHVNRATSSCDSTPRTRKLPSTWRKRWSRSARRKPMPPSGWSRAATRPSCRPIRRGPQLAAAKAQLETAKAELARNEIYAPFNGVIDRVPVERGSAIMAGGEVATLINLDPLLAIGEVSERDLQYLKLGNNADIRLVNGETVKGTLRYISRDASAADPHLPHRGGDPQRGQAAAGRHDC